MDIAANCLRKCLYIDKCISDILSDILDKCGGGYNFDMTPNGIRIYKYGAIYAYPEFRITPNTHLIYSPTLKGNVSHNLSIEDMKNSVKVVTETDKVYTVKAVMKDADSIYKYGVLQDVFKIDEKDGDANTHAKNRLSAPGKVEESFSRQLPHRKHRPQHKKRNALCEIGTEKVWINRQWTKG